MADEVSVLVEGGKASAGPPLGPALGPLGVNVGPGRREDQRGDEAVRRDARARSSSRSTPRRARSPWWSDGRPVAALLLKEAGKEKGSGKPKTETSGT